MDGEAARVAASELRDGRVQSRIVSATARDVSPLLDMTTGVWDVQATRLPLQG